MELKRVLSSLGGGPAMEGEVMDTTTLLIILIIILVAGGGFYGRGRWF